MLLADRVSELQKGRLTALGVVCTTLLLEAAPGACPSPVLGTGLVAIPDPCLRAGLDVTQAKQVPVTVTTVYWRQLTC